MSALRAAARVKPVVVMKAGAPRHRGRRHRVPHRLAGRRRRRVRRGDAPRRRAAHPRFFRAVHGGCHARCGRARARQAARHRRQRRRSRHDRGRPRAGPRPAARRARGGRRSTASPPNCRRPPARAIRCTCGRTSTARSSPRRPASASRTRRWTCCSRSWCRTRSPIPMRSRARSSRSRKDSRKPVFACWMGGNAVEASRAHFAAHRVPSYMRPGDRGGRRRRHGPVRLEPAVAAAGAGAGRAGLRAGPCARTGRDRRGAGRRSATG